VPTHRLLWVPRALGILLALSGAANAQFTPATGSPIAVCTFCFPIWVAVADLNGNGPQDLAIADPSADTVTVLIGNGTGEFLPGPSSPYPVGTNPKSVAIGDFNGDGLPDLAIANSNDGTVTVLLNSKSGVFTAATNSPFSVGAEPTSVVVGDFNKDGKLDLAFANELGNNVTLLLGNGSGGFTAATGSPFAVGNGPHSLVAADFNGDGNLDLAVANATDGTVTVLLGNGSGGFTAASGSPFPAGADPIFVAEGNFNRDGKPDLALVNEGNDTVTVLLNNGSGGFTQAPASPFPVGDQPVSVAVGDFNGDGNLDLVIANSGSNNVTELYGNGKGGFTEAPGSPFNVGTDPEFVAVADFNGDGKPDLAVANADDSTVSILLNTYSATAAVVVSAASGTAPVAPGSIVSIYGSDLAASAASATTLPLPTSLGGASVTVTDSSGAQTALPLFYASPKQINAEIPQSAATGGATLTITTASGSQKAPVTLAAVAPGLFSANQTGAGVAAAQFVADQSNGTQTTVDIFQCSGGAGSCVAVPLDVSGGNTALVLYGTGIENRAALSDVTVTIGSHTLPATYAGAAPNYAGEDQVDVLLPASLAGSGTVNVSVTVSGTVSNVVTVDIQ
jgi:uncharacterized protein (TIGR03437 family)